MQENPSKPTSLTEGTKSLAQLACLGSAGTVYTSFAESAADIHRSMVRSRQIAIRDEITETTAARASASIPALREKLK
jgi:hypothetical protein